MAEILAYVIDKDGNTTALSDMISYELIHSVDSCDAFCIEILYSESYYDILHSACEIRIENSGETYFVGLIDECKYSASTSATIEISGRGYSARLLDNEAQSAEYWGASTSFILQNHVYPYGIAQIECGTGQNSGRFTISSGQSQWKVLTEFCTFVCGSTPRFNRFGTLLIAGETGDAVVIDSAAISAQTVVDDRYGVVSKVTVKNTSDGTQTICTNDDFIDRGGLCERVVNVPRYSAYDYMRYTGDYQIEQSEKDSWLCKITIPQIGIAFAGDIVSLSSSPLDISGNFYVTESVLYANASGAGTTLTMRRT